jgi:prepilin-type processing-associated H-X9-DG protein
MILIVGAFPSAIYSWNYNSAGAFGNSDQQLVCYRHGSKGNFLFSDLHVESYKFAEMMGSLDLTNNTGKLNGVFREDSIVIYLSDYSEGLDVSLAEFEIEVSGLNR